MGMAGAAQPHRDDDISALRARIDELERREAELSDLIDNAAVAIHRVGPDGTILWANQAELDLLGYAPEEYIGRPVTDFHADAAAIADILDRLGRSETLRDCPAVLRAKDGSLRHVLISSNVFRQEGRFVHTRCFTRDVTDRKRVEDVLRARESELCFALEAARMGTWEWDIATGKVSWSPGLEKVHCRPEGSFDGRFSTVLAEIYPPDRAGFESALSSALDGSGEFRAEYRIVAPDGRFHWIQGRGTVARDPERKPVRMVGVCLDITERKRHEILLAEQKRVLELATRGAPLETVLGALTRVVEEHCGTGLLASILLLDAEGKTLRHGAAPSLPRSYSSAVDGLAIGPSAGSCGTAAFRGETVIVADIETDPLWVNYRALALEHGLRACWSTPILSSRGQVLGTFAVYSSRPLVPAPEDLEATELLGRTAAIVLERQRAGQELARSVEQLQALYAVSTAAAHAGTAAEIAGTALTGLMRCIGPDRAAVLLFDEAGIMRFAAARGLSGPYRAKVEGHSPWTRGTTQAAPILVPDPSAVPVLEPYLEAIRQEGIASLAFIPVKGESGVQGKFMIYYDSPHVFTPDEIKLAETVAVQIGFTLERRRAEQAVRESEDRFRSLGACSPVGIFLTDLDGRCTYTNPRCQEIFEVGPDDNVGRGWGSFLEPGERDAVLGRWRESVAEGRSFSEEIRLRTASGEFRWVLVRTSPMVSRSGAPLGHVGSVEDITARKGAERRLTMQYEVTRILNESATVDEVAPRLLETIGHSLDVQTGAWWSLDKDSALLRCQALWQSPSAGPVDLISDNRTRSFPRGVGLPVRVWASRQSVWIRDIQTQLQIPRTASHANSGLRSAIAFPILLEGGETAGVLEFFSQTVHEPDFLLLHTLEAIGSQTGQFIERRHLEEELRQSQKAESIGLLAGGVAHDFNNLLVGVMGNASLAADYLDESHPARRLMDDVVRASERAAELTRQLLAYAGRGQFVSTCFSVSELVQDISSLLRSTVSRNIGLELQLSKSMAPIEADPSQIQQLVMNLLINAVEAIGGDRPGTILVKTGTYDVDPGYARAHFAGQNLATGKYVGLEVTDNGCGMSPETRNKIFDPFFSTKALGRGLGLAAAAGIVRSYKGAISVESEPGRGSTFLVLLPAAAGEASSLETAREQQPLEPGKGTVLVVDDEEVVRNIAKAALESAGFDVVLAGDGLDAVSVLARRGADIDAIVLDLSMPVMSGEATARAVRAAHPGIPILLSSGYNESDARKRLGEGAVDGFIQKPYRVAELARAVRSLLGRGTKGEAAA